MTRARDLAKLGDQNNFSVDGSNNVGLGSTIPDSKLDVIGILSATSFYGDGSALAGVGLGTVLGSEGALNAIYYTNDVLDIHDTTTITVPAGSDKAYTQYQEVVVANTKDLIISAGDEFIPDVLGLSTSLVSPISGSGGRVRADFFTNHAGTGAPEFQAGLRITGIVTATGQIVSGGDAGGGANDGSVMNGGSGFSASFNNASSLIYRGYTTGNSTPTFSVSAEGMILTGPGRTASDTYASMEAGQIGVQRASGGDSKIWSGALGGTETTFIKAGGAAKFAGSIEVGATTSSGFYPINAKINDTSFSSIIAVNTATAGQGRVFTANAGSSELIYFMNDGSATFTGSVTSSTSTLGGVVLNESVADGITIYAPSGAGLKTSLKSNGSASFAAGSFLIESSSNAYTAGFIIGDSTGAFDGTNNKFKLNPTSGSADFGHLNTGQTTGYGVYVDVTANAGRVLTQIQGTGSQFTDMINVYFGSTKTFHALANGNVENLNNSYGQISDVSLKENIVDANSQWADIKAVRVRNFNFKEGQTHKQIGVIAQELETVSPGLVYENDDNLKSVSHSILYMKAIKALQEAMSRIETLETQNAALEARLTALEG
tara:strand:+ start:287 stop:2095 length:1809 start_codon:yes stop_codon:yes gene_type:complete